ncbi:diacylglycerol kinase family protein [uncultured Bacteroides sp.]|uniref:diacylglycerol kinase family protein n=1 Tax=uncultured Bacteroides sp. TaxID=162156 RepID=UPI002AA679AF|nr:diacylglycerol kinase family protein [uncultured Bacteroides sp.]
MKTKDRKAEDLEVKPNAFRKILKSFSYAGTGIVGFLRAEHNAWVHCLAIVVVTAAGFCFHIAKNEWIAVIFCFGLVLAAEAFNTAIERLTDLVSPQQSPIAGNVKDIAAGAVLICAIVAAIIGLIIFIPYFIEP